MASLIERGQRTASRLIGRESQGVNAYVHPGEPTGPAYDPQPGEPTEYPVSAVKAPSKMKEKYVSGGYIQQSDLLLTVSSFDREPTLAGSMRSNGDLYQIIMIDSATIEPGTPVVWRIGCRK